MKHTLSRIAILAIALIALAGCEMNVGIPPGSGGTSSTIKGSVRIVSSSHDVSNTTGTCTIDATVSTSGISESDIRRFGISVGTTSECTGKAKGVVRGGGTSGSCRAMIRKQKGTYYYRAFLETEDGNTIYGSNVKSFRIN